MSPGIIAFLCLSQGTNGGIDCGKFSSSVVFFLLSFFRRSLSFIGLGFRILPFPFFEIQAKWVARLLTGRAALPGARVMEERALALDEDEEAHRQKIAEQRHKLAQHVG